MLGELSEGEEGGAADHLVFVGQALTDGLQQRGQHAAETQTGSELVSPASVRKQAGARSLLCADVVCTAFSQHRQAQETPLLLVRVLAAQAGLGQGDLRRNNREGTGANALTGRGGVGLTRWWKSFSGGRWRAIVSIT